MQLDDLDRKAAAHFEGYVVRKDLVRQFSRQFPVPTYVVEFLLGRYCATMDEEEIAEGLDIVQRQLASRTVKAGEQELFKARAREDGTVRIIDLVSARLDAKTDAYLAMLPSLQLKDVRIAPEMVREHERLLTGGFYAEVTLGYDSSIAQEAHGRPFGIEALRAIQLSKRDVLQVLAQAREGLSSAEWKAFLLRSVGLEPDQLDERAQDALLLRMVPFVERNYNLVELGPRGTGKSHLFQQVSPYAHLISGGKATVAGQRLPIRMLHPAAHGEPAGAAPGPGPPRRRAERPRHQQGRRASRSSSSRRSSRARTASAPIRLSRGRSGP